MRRITRLAPLALVAALALTSCSASAASEEPITESSEASISYAVWDENQVPALEANIAAFNEIYPNIEVKIDITPWAQYWTKLQTQASGGTLPDVFWMNGPNFQLYAANDQLEPMTNLIDAGDVDPANYVEVLNELYSYDDVQYGMPKDFDTVALWYNKAILAEAGVATPDDTWTWDDFHTAAKTVSDTLADQGVYGVATGLTGGQEGYYNTILQAGGFVLSDDGTTSGYDDPKTIRGLQFWADLIADGSSPSLQQLSDTPHNAWFTSSKTAFFWSGTWSVSELAAASNTLDLNVAPLPQDEKQATVIHGVANVVSANSPNKSAAQAFQAYLGGEEAQTLQAEMGAANPAFIGAGQAFLDSVDHFDLQVFIDEADNYAYPFPVSKDTAAWSTIENELLPQAFSGARTVEDVAGELATRMNEALAKE
ncbi:sugar ABC transporter substrate-binding protein [Cryobacterium sp. PH29-G1]|uniref:ABC transporter substrate-binding protein n=1 Tax=Cryobacterium sp. PH29-G1 TaxID=3046211 RepID=UPI0024BA482B|nr:sugar ABC transporter substrate-binding protein [Cryobacterium sp. PH29-G1]MDJ0347957.1 sugar ABC transporter substrate-binding protein [Cryobacterium sp. PH29-G1]